MTDSETRLRLRLRRMIDGPAADEKSPQPLVQVHVIPEPTPPDTTDDEDEPEDEDDDPEEQPEKALPWWQTAPRPFGHRAPEPAPDPQDTIAAAPGIHVTVNQPTAASPPWTVPDPADQRAQERLYRRRIWLAYHGGAAAVGWFLGLVAEMGELIADAGPAAPGAGVALGLVTYIVASYLPGLPYVPPALRPVIVWAARIPVCSAALALALNAPGIV
ncbi:hypothetical protein ACFT7S_28285 [Streptomyces sp. NPDC057136]|uniref:hypothetical protein n=1 Tax=Streptomyces sp. NPDC057136 TaxID=3346029 RepID=UPI0036352719